MTSVVSEKQLLFDGGGGGVGVGEFSRLLGSRIYLI